MTNSEFCGIPAIAAREWQTTVRILKIRFQLPVSSPDPLVPGPGPFGIRHLGFDIWHSDFECISNVSLLVSNLQSL